MNFKDEAELVLGGYSVVTGSNPKWDEHPEIWELTLRVTDALQKAYYQGMEAAIKSKNCTHGTLIRKLANNFDICQLCGDKIHHR